MASTVGAAARQWVGRMSMATGSAIQAGVGQAMSTFRRVYSDPTQMEGGYARPAQANNYGMLWAYYQNSVFEDLGAWAGYKGRYGLYRNIRSLYNPTRRLVDFYAAHIYPGVLSEDGKALPDGVDLAIPFATDTPPALVAAVAAFWHWSNWQARKDVFVTWAAAAGNVLVELVDDVDAGKITAEVVWPALVTDLDLDPAGNVRLYALQYQVTGDDNIPYTYRKEVDRDEFRTFKNGQPFDYSDDGTGAAYPNPYGFVPAVWVKHQDLGGDYGAPAIEGSIRRIDEINHLASLLHDQVATLVKAPKLIAAEGRIQRWQDTARPAVSAAGQALAPGPVAGSPPVPVPGAPPTQATYDAANADRQNLGILQAGKDATVHSLSGDVPLADALAIMQELITELEHAHPELVMYTELREMSQVTGPAATRLMGDVANAVYKAAAGYDRASIALFGMAVAMGGMRANAGDWGPAETFSARQRLFLPFDLTSYHQGDLDMAIGQRPLMRQTALESLQEQQQRISVEQAEVALQQQKAALAAVAAAPPQTLITVKEQ